MTPMLRKLHKWVGLVVGVQFLLWLASGLVMSLFDHHAVMGEARRAPAPAERFWPLNGLQAPSGVLAAAGRPAALLETGWLGARPVYKLSHEGNGWLVDAATGKPVQVAVADVLAAAKADYRGTAPPGTPKLLDSPGLEARRHAGPVWRVDFADAEGTTLYLSSVDAKVLERRNDLWRWFDLAWMLHIMDYSGREDFNNSLVVMAAVGGVWMALSGIWLLATSFRLREFIPRRWLPVRDVEVVDGAGRALATAPSFEGDTVYLALARAGMNLPSNCGGGQSCGLCEVRIGRNPPAPTSADREHIAPARLRDGHRLACSLEVNGNLRVAVANGAAIVGASCATVESVTAVTPYLREIVLVPESRAGAEFRPGSYIQLRIPRYKLAREHLHLPEHHRAEWHGLRLPSVLRSSQPVRRSYSLSMPVVRADGRLHLLVRFSPGSTDAGHAPGRGSSYIYSLKSGDTVSFNGPFGEFALRPGKTEKIFIGGGAGMAPLRAMILSLLDGAASETIHFWYGARSGRDVPYEEEMRTLAAQYSNFDWRVVLSESGEAGHGMVHEVVQRELLAKHPHLRDCDFYVCGPPQMLAATRKMLADFGVRKVAFDDFKI